MTALFVRKNARLSDAKHTIYSLYEKQGREYVQYGNYGFSSKAKAEQRAASLEAKPEQRHPQPARQSAATAEPVKGVRYGNYRGPSGRARNLYNVQAFKRGGREREENAHAYGGVGVRQAKKHIHQAQAKRGIKALTFHTYNETTKQWRKRG